MNTVTLSGRIARDINPFYTERGLCISNFTLIVQRPSKKKKEDTPPSDQPKESCDYISCVAFGKQAETLANFIHKGKRIFVNGKLQSSSYTNKEGTKVYKTEVVVSSFEYMENRDPSGEVVNVDSFASFGVEDIEF